MIFAVGAAFAQKKPFIHNNGLPTTTTNKLFPLNVKTSEPVKLRGQTNVFLSPGFYASQLGFFCRQEIKFEKVTKVPFKFRLGSVETCDYLEGKRR